MRKFSAATLIIWTCLMAVQGVSYVRYYRTEQDFIRDIRMEATGRERIAHIRAFYSVDDRILSKTNIDTGGRVIREEFYEYDFSGILLRRSIRNESGRTEKMYVYGDGEEMSKTFLAYAYPHSDLREFTDRTTVYTYLPDGKVDQFEFLSVGGTRLGSISYEYFDTGLVREERWVTEPLGKTVRLFQYAYDPELKTYELIEYDSNGEKISHVGLVIPFEGTQGRVNILPESSEIIEEIMARRDVIYLKNGDSLHVDLVQITDSFVRFKRVEEPDTLTMPLSAVEEIELQDGRIVYPAID